MADVNSFLPEGLYARLHLNRVHVSQLTAGAGCLAPAYKGQLFPPGVAKASLLASIGFVVLTTPERKDILLGFF